MSRKRNAINHRRRGHLFRQFTTIIKIHNEILYENTNRTEIIQNGSDVKLITMQS